jgi:lysophospholipase L1-like esterase
MRRFTSWYLPLAIAIIAAAIFADGLIAYLRDDLGTPVNLPVRPAANAGAPRDAISLMIIGDSLAHGTGDDSGFGIGGRIVEGLRARHQRVNEPVNIAVDGSRSKNLLEQLQSRNVRTLLAQSNVIVVSIGGNDLWGDNFRGGPPPNPIHIMDEVLGRVEEAVHTVRDASPKARVFVIGLYNPFAGNPMGDMLTPFVNRWNARLIEGLGSDKYVTIVQTSDIFAFHQRLSVDQFHPSAEGYALIGRRILDAL